MNLKTAQSVANDFGRCAFLGSGVGAQVHGHLDLMDFFSGRTDAVVFVIFRPPSDGEVVSIRARSYPVDDTGCP